MLDIARRLEEVAGQLHGLAFDVGENGVTKTAEAEADRIVDAILTAVHEDRT